MVVWHFSPVALTLIVAGILGSVAAVYTWAHRTQVGAAASAALLGMAIWTSAYGMALGIHALDTRIFWAKVQHIGIAIVAVAGPLFAVHYSRQPWAQRRWLAPLLALLPAIGLLLVWTNELHRLIWVQTRLQITDGLALLAIDYGPYFYLYSTYNYALLAAAALLLFIVALRASGLQRRQAFIIFGGAALPAAAAALQMAGRSPLPNLDLLPFGYALGALVVAFGLMRYRLFDIVPVARTRVLEEMVDAVLVLDARDRLLDYNSAAAAFLAQQGVTVTANVVATRLPPPLLAALPATGGGHWQFSADDGPHTYAVAVSRLDTEPGGRAGRVVIFHDITALTAAQAAVQAAHVQVVEQQRMLAVLEERERLGRDLHDGLGQVVAYIHVQAQSVRALLDQGQQAAADAALRQLEHAARAANADLRAHLLGVRRARPDAAAPFFAALQHYLADHAAAGALRVNLTVAPALDQSAPFTPEVGAQTLYIIQEALTNARKHAGVDLVALDFAVEGNCARITICDNGDGFDPAAAPAATHYGLAVMAERAESVGGALHVAAAPGQGVQITLTVPLAQAGTLPGAGEETQLQGLRVVLADDHPLFLDGLRTLLTAHGAQVAGLAHDGVEAQRLAAAVQPALILMDVHMPHCDGLEATRRIHLAQPEIKIVMLTLAADEDSLHQALAAGASGYLLKSLDTLTFVRALAEILRGEVSLSPDIAAQILASFTTADAHAAETALTPQQTHILELVAQGLLYKQVAASLSISEATVKYHMGQILERLHVKNRGQAIAVARRRGLISDR